ncbi:hypothetical protein BT93_F2670 [Corymbia citriodora subsp. variegata]|nr:hypothetical protein BT93_F2670 [Corymbia citriodora subsp. variegata]
MPPLDDDNEPLLPEFVIRVKDSITMGLASNEKSSWTIDIVPRNWRDVHKNAFLPEIIRIGPFTFTDENETFHRLRVMEKHKVRFLNRLLRGELERRRRQIWTEEKGLLPVHERGEDDDDGGRVAEALRLDDLLEAMHILEPKTRAFYSENFPSSYGRIGFMEMMVVDGCFLVELLRLYYDLLHKKSAGESIEDDPILTNPQILTTLRRDLLLLENQLPFFVLEKLFELINKKNNIDHQQAVRLEVLAVTFFDPLLPQEKARAEFHNRSGDVFMDVLNPASKLDAQKPKAHLLDVFRSTFLTSVNEKVHKKGQNQVKPRLNPDGRSRGIVLHSASELQEAGVQFEKWKDHDLLDIKSGHRTLRVPPLSLSDYTISLLLNFVGYELSVNHPEPFFTNYLMFWNSLVNSPRDIQILRKHRIINNMGSEKEVAELLLRCKQVIYDLDLGYLYHEMKDVNDYCKRYYDSKYHVWWRSLIRERFSSPWTCLSLFAAIILLLLTLLQTFYAMYAYYRPH